MKYTFIINPVSGNKKGLIIGKLIEEYCTNKGIDYKILYTREKDDAKKLASIYSNYSDTIYSVGGDGTLNEVVNGLANSGCKLSIIPCGSGNDFYKTFKDCNYDVIDLGKVNDKYFINVASIGLDAKIAKEAQELKKYKIPSKLIYVLSAIKNLLTYDGVRLNIDDENEFLTLLTICNGKYYGNGFKIAPLANITDGLLDIILVEKLPNKKIIKLFYELIKAIHLNDDDVISYETNLLNVSSKIELICNVDGEIIRGKEFKFETESFALNIDNNDSIDIIKYLKSKKLIK